MSISKNFEQHHEALSCDTTEVIASTPSSTTESGQSNKDLPVGELGRNRFAGSREIRAIVPVSTMTLWRWTKSGKIPAPTYIGNRRMWHVGEFLAALGL